MENGKSQWKTNESEPSSNLMKTKKSNGFKEPKKVPPRLWEWIVNNTHRSEAAVEAFQEGSDGSDLSAEADRRAEVEAVAPPGKRTRGGCGGEGAWRRRGSYRRRGASMRITEGSRRRRRRWRELGPGCSEKRRGRFIHGDHAFITNKIREKKGKKKKKKEQ